MGAFGVLAFPLVGVLVSAESLGGGKDSAAVMAFELPAACLRALALSIINGAAASEFFAEKPYGAAAALFFSRAGEGQLGERLHVHEVTSLSLIPVHGSSLESE